MAVLASDWSTQLIFLSPWNHCRDLNEITRELSSFKMSLYFWQRYQQIWPPWPLIVWCTSDFCSETVVWISTKFYRKQVLTKCITSFNQLVFLLVQLNNYTIAQVSYWLTRFQFLRNRYRDSNKMLGKKVQFSINFA